MYIINYSKYPVFIIKCLDWVRDSGKLLGREGYCAECEAEQEVRGVGVGVDVDDCVLQGGGGGDGVWQCEVQTGLSQLSPGGDRREGELSWSALWDMRQETKVNTI